MRRLVFLSAVLLAAAFCVSSFCQSTRGLNSASTVSPEIRSQTYVEFQRAHVAQIKKQIYALGRRYEQSFLDPNSSLAKRMSAHRDLGRATRGYREAVRKLQQAEDDVLKRRHVRDERLRERHENRRRIERLDSHRDFVQRAKGQYEYWEQAFQAAAHRARRTQGFGPEVVAARAHIEAVRMKKNYWEQAWKQSQSVYGGRAKRSRL